MQVALCSDWYGASAVARKPHRRLSMTGIETSLKRMIPQRHPEATIKMAALGRACVEASSHFVFSLKIMKLLQGN
jgi:hypothetical protein